MVTDAAAGAATAITSSQTKPVRISKPMHQALRRHPAAYPGYRGRLQAGSSRRVSGARQVDTINPGLSAPFIARLQRTAQSLMQVKPPIGSAVNYVGTAVRLAEPA